MNYRDSSNSHITIQSLRTNCNHTTPARHPTRLIRGSNNSSSKHDHLIPTNHSLINKVHHKAILYHHNKNSTQLRTRHTHQTRK